MTSASTVKLMRTASATGWACAYGGSWATTTIELKRVSGTSHMPMTKVIAATPGG